jgi:uncharacterized membrane-anchored protein YjiN (DUF445 family)
MYLGANRAAVGARLLSQKDGRKMKIVLRIVAILLVAMAAFLVYAVIHAMASAGGARAGVAVGYIVGAILLSWAATALWRRPGRSSATA